MSPKNRINDEQVLVLAPTSADGRLTRSILSEAAIECLLCTDVNEVVDQLGESVGAMLLTDDVLVSGDVRPLVDALESQPPWSDLPVILLSSAREDSPISAWTIERLGNVTVLERPVRLTTLVSSLRSALRARRRQYELRDQLEALGESEEQFRGLAEGMPHCVWICDADGRNTYLNGVWYGFTGSEPGSCHGGDWLDVFHPDDRAHLMDEWSKALASDGEHVYDIEVRARRHDGQYRWFRVKGSPIRDSQGRTIRWVGTCTDTHEQRRLLDALRDADRRKDEFLAMLAHELRNPLAPIRTGLQVIQLCGDDPETTADTLQMMGRQLHQLVRLIDDLLDISRITSGKIELRREPCQLSTVLSMAIESSRPVIEDSGVELTVSMPRQDVELDADPVRLSQVFSNLLTNAAKYTERGGHIWLTAELQESEVHVTVRDTGIGIRPEMLSRIFEMFTQVDRTERSRSGLGIGLSLVRALVDLHGGTVQGHSEGAGCGSEFKVRLPVVRGAQAVGRPSSAAVGRNDESRRVLVVDDNTDAANALSLMLRLMGNEVRIAHDGLEAVETCEAYGPDLVLLDLGMPRLNGYEAAQRIRQEQWGREMTLVALTGWGQEEDRRKSRDAGFDAHLVKPVDRDALAELLATVAARTLREP